MHRNAKKEYKQIPTHTYADKHACAGRQESNAMQTCLELESAEV